MISKIFPRLRKQFHLYLLKGIFSNLFVHLISFLRLKPLIYLLQLKHFPARKLFSDLWDPNLIRKKTRKRLGKEKIIKFNFVNMKGEYILDLNDHLDYRIFIDEQLDNSIIKIAETIGFSSNQIFLDIGANKGFLCIPLALRFDCAIIAVEPSRQNMARLLENSALNNIKLIPLSFCLTTPENTVLKPFIRMFAPEGNSGATSIYASWNPSKGPDSNFEISGIPTATLDQLLTSFMVENIGLIKLDVEGSELEVLQGFKKLSTINAPIVFEYRPDLYKKATGLSIAEMVKYLENYFSIFTVDFKHSPVGLRQFDQNVKQEHVLGLPKKFLENYLNKFHLMN